jgi:hypothetical protein
MPRILPVQSQLNEIQPFPVKEMETNFYETLLNPLQIIHNKLKSITTIEKSVLDPLKCVNVVACMEEMKRVKLEEVGLTESILRTKSTSYSMDIVCAENYQMSVFVLPKGCMIPLHNHPHMTVCSKLLIGSMHLRSFTPQQSSWSFFTNEKTAASLDFDGIKSSSDDPWLLTPNKDNVHEFSAITDCVILDILLPPYGEPHRPCIFYKASSQSQISGEDTWQLREMTVEEQETVQLPSMVYYEGFVPRQM